MVAQLALKSDDLRDEAKRAMASQKRPTITVLSSLLAIQDHVGYLPNEAIEEVASAMDQTVNAVFGGASFYPNFRFTPPGKHSVEICWGPTCHINGAPMILEETLKTLGIASEGETNDNEYSFRFNTCLGACSQAPVVSIDHELYGKTSPDEVNKLLNEVQNNPATH